MKKQKRIPALEDNGRGLKRRGQKLEYEIDKLLNYKTISVILFISIYGLLAILEWIDYLTNRPQMPYIFTGVFIVVAIIGIFKLKKQFKMVKKIKQELDGERNTAEKIDSFKGKDCKIFHDFPIEYGNIDHIVINICGIFTIETKTVRKAAGKNNRIVYDGKNIKFKSGKYINYPIEQARSEAKCLRELLSDNIENFHYFVQPIVVYPAWYVKGTHKINKDNHKVWVITEKYLDGLINNERQKLGKEDVKQISNILESLNP